MSPRIFTIIYIYMLSCFLFHLDICIHYICICYVCVCVSLVSHQRPKSTLSCMLKDGWTSHHSDELSTQTPVSCHSDISDQSLRCPVC